ncbi:MAG: glycosyltransferase family 2 protein [Sphingomonadales bacterium]
MPNAIVILNYNGLAHLQTYLPSVVENSPNWDIFIADNASTDTSVSFAAQAFPLIKIIQLAQNFGFAEGYNQALATIEGKYEHYFILNSDVRLRANWDLPLLDFMKINPGTAAVGPKILSDRQPDYFEHAGAAGGYLDTFYFPFCRGRIFESVEQDLQQYDGAQEVTWVSGAALLIRSKDFHEAGGFDAQFFAHMEEIDLCLRLASAGKKLYCVPQSKVFHLGGGTLSYDNPQKAFLNFRNSLWMIVKNQRRFLIPVLFIRMALDGLAAIQFLVKGKPQLSWEIFLAHMALYRHFITFYNKRQKTSAQAYKYHGLIIWDYFGKGVRNFSALNKRKFHS